MRTDQIYARAAISDRLLHQFDILARYLYCMRQGLSYFVLLSTMIFACCNPDESPGDLIGVEQDKTAYELTIPAEFPDMLIPADNPLTVAGVDLGKRLFHDPILSVDGTVACASCHLQESVFSDPRKFSLGVDGQEGTRQAMSIINAGFFENGLFWDGRVDDLETLSAVPVEDPVEQAHDWNRLEEILKEHDTYPELFAKAFGIKDSEEITRDLATKALAQYQRALVSTADSKVDRFSRNEYFLSDLELDGFQMYFDASFGSLPDAECGHCHNGPFFTTNRYENNGLTEADSSLMFPDLGRYEATGLWSDRGKFRVPTLRNIEFTAPYMHDGRFQTLEEVVDHYNSGGHFAPNLNPLIRPLGLNEYQKEALVAFLKTTSDTSFLSQEIFQSPFE